MLRGCRDDGIGGSDGMAHGIGVLLQMKTTTIMNYCNSTQDDLFSKHLNFNSFLNLT